MRVRIGIFLEAAEIETVKRYAEEQNAEHGTDYGWRAHLAGIAGVALKKRLIVLREETQAVAAVD